MGESSFSLQASADYLYGLGGSDATHVQRMPIAGGAWVNVTSVWSGHQLSIVGDVLYRDKSSPDGSWQLFRGPLNDPNTTASILSFGTADEMGHWVGTSAGVFWTDWYTLRYRSIAAE